jgi:hypothetical protein
MKNKPHKAPRQESRQVSTQEQQGKGPRVRKVSRAVASPAIELSNFDVSRLAVETFCHARTVERWKDGEPVNPSTKLRLERACVKLGIARPPRPTGGVAA